jgi:tetraacyldisaccharide 4'-kinase
LNKNFIEKMLLRAWMRRGLLACLLWPLSLLFGLVVNFRFALFVLGYKKSTRLPVPVIVVGNIFLGGTGKTPLVIYLVQQLRVAGWQPGVISRGYQVQAQRVGMHDQVEEVSASSQAAVVGDEPLLIALRCACPVMVGRDRVASAQALLARHPEVNLIITDDGLQHYALQRDIEMMLFDQRGVGNGWLLPAGPLRESARRRRDFTILNVSSQTDSAIAIAQQIMPPDDQAAITMRLVADQVVALADPSLTLSLAEFCRQSETQSVTAAAGIGNPQRFFDSLQQAGLRFTSLALPDHHAYTADSFAGLQADLILITEKDAVKCRQIDVLKNDARIWVLPVSAQLEATFLPRLIEMLTTKFNTNQASTGKKE